MEVLLKFGLQLALYKETCLGYKLFGHKYINTLLQKPISVVFTDLQFVFRLVACHSPLY